VKKKKAKKKIKKKIKKKANEDFLIKIPAEIKNKYDDLMWKFLSENEPKYKNEIGDLVDVLSRALIFVITTHWVKYEHIHVVDFLNRIHKGIKEGFEMRDKK
jgi:hypothetical protein